MDNTDKGEVVSAPSGSKAVARCQKDGAGTGETQGVPRDEVCNNKPIDGKELQKASWESDQSIVVMKLRNGSGAKGLAGKSMGRGHIFRTQRRIKGGNKTLSTTYIGREVFLKSRMREICTSGSVRGLIVAPDDNNL